MKVSPGQSDWSDLQAFLAISRAGSLARAADLVGLDATTLGRRLRRLEERLNTNLFERSRDGQVLTEAGEALLEAVETMAQAAAVIGEHADAQSGPSGTVRLSASEGFGTWFITRHVRALSEAWPRLALDLVASSGFLNPSRREADIAIMLSRPRAGPLIARKLSDYALQLFASPEYLARSGTPVTAADLAEGHSLIGYIPDLIYSPELRYLSEFHPELSAGIRSSSISAQLRLVAEGAGIAVLPCFMASTVPGLVPVLPRMRITRSFWLVTHKDTHNFTRIRATRDWLIGAVKQDRDLLMPALAE